MLVALRKEPAPGTRVRRLCFCLLMLLACADVAAREVRLSSADSGSAPDTAGAAAPAPKSDARRNAAPRDAANHEARVRPSVHSDVGSGPRMRWHSFLPGMFR